MIQLFIDFLGITGQLPWFIEYFIILAVLFMGVWLVCNFINLFMSTIFNIFR